MEPKEYKLIHPVEFGGSVIDTLTARHIVTVDDLEDGYEEIDILRKSKNKPPVEKKELTNTEMMKLVLAKATGQPVEVIGTLAIKDFNALATEFKDFLL